MTSLPPPAPVDRTRSRRPGDGGFVLLESIVTISLITIVMTALASFFLNAIASTNQQRARQTATQIAASAVENLRGLHASDLVDGRDAAGVSSQFGAASATVRPWLAAMDPATDPTAAAGSGATAAIPTLTVNQSVNNVVYGVNNYLGWCGVDSTSPDCQRAAVSTGTTYLRAVVAVTWRDKRCPASACTYLTASLFSTADDPTFNLNQVPPAAPVAVNPGPQKAVIPEPQQLQLAAVANTGVPPYTWQITGGGLPAGLLLSPAGEITGRPTTAVTNLAVTVTVTDAFLRTASVTFLWTVYPPLTITAPGDQTSARSAAISPLLLTATGGIGAPYAWSDQNGTLPPGLTISTVTNQGRVAGTPTTVGRYAVQLAVKDASNSRTTAVSFSWTITYPPLTATTPPSQRSTVNRAIALLQLSTSGGSGSSSWSGTGLPPGIALSGSGQLTGTPTATGTYSVQLTATDPTAATAVIVSFSWTVFAAPTVVTPPDQVTRIGATVNLAVASSCPNAPCTFSLAGAPSALTIDADGDIVGTVTSAAQTFLAVKVTVTDSAGVPTTTAAFKWLVGTYTGVVSTTPGLLSYWRLGEPATSLIASDSFTGTAASTLAGRNAELGGTWATLNGTAGKISTEGRVYRSGTGWSLNYRPAVPPSVNYAVEADLFTKTNVAGDRLGVVGRLITSDNSYYLADWEQANTSWNLIRVVRGTATYLGSLTGQPAMTPGRSTRLRLDVSGNGTTSTLSLYVNGVRTVGPVNDTTAILQTVGRGGFLDGNISNSALAAKADQTGLHLDNFQVTPGVTTALLSRGRPVTASSLEQAAFPAASAVDGDTGTRWSSAYADPQWIQIDLGATVTVRQVVLNWETAYGKAFQVEVSAASGGPWAPIYQTTTGTGGIQTLNVTGTGRYIRMYGTQRGTTYGYSLFEFDVYGDGPAAYPRAVDKTGSNTGDYENGVVLGKAGALAGDTDTAAQLDGVNEYVQATSTTGLPVGASARSVELWFKTTGPAKQTLFDYGSLATDAKFGLFLEADGTTMTAWGYASEHPFKLSRAVNDGLWHHVVKTYNGTSLALYVDGVPVGAPATRATVLDAYGFSIGAVLSPDPTNNGKFFKGTIDEVAVYTVALSAADVASHYELGSP